MRCLSLTQPYASLVVMDEKSYETRSWKPSKNMMDKIKGKPVAIHAGKKLPTWMISLPKTSIFARSLYDFYRNVDDLPLGAIVGTVEILGFVQTEKIVEYISPKEFAFGDYSAGRWAWNLWNPRMLKTPIPCNGMLSLWEVPSNIRAQLYTAEYF